MTGGLGALADRFEAWLTAARGDDQLTAFRRTTTLVVALEDGESRVSVEVTPDSVQKSAPQRTAEVTLVAPVAAWNSLLSAAPEPTMNHFLAMKMRVDGARIEGDELKFAQEAHVIRRLLDLARGVVDADVPRALDERLDRSRIAGRYVSISIDGADIDLYVEEQGDADEAPLLVLHTAGADSRQAHPLMGDESLGRRVVAFDLPGHGRSDALPGPLGTWTLTADRYVEAVSGIIEALGLQRPVLLGASMAGQACLLMAARIPHLLGGVIACEASDMVAGRVTPWAGDSRVNEALYVPEWIEGLIGPGSSRAMHDLIWRSYSQGGHRTFAGDIDFYSGGGWDGRRLVTEIDTKQCPVVLMTGEYDYSCLPAMSEATAAKIVGAHYWTMPGLGHFPLTENPVSFRPHLDRALSLMGEVHA